MVDGSEMTDEAYPIRNLVFRGGGVKAFAYHGALRALDEEGILPRIERVAGTSAGGTTAALVSFRLSADDTIALFKRLNYAKVRKRMASDFHDWPVLPPKGLEESLEFVKGSMDAVARLFSRYGWYANDYSREWLKAVIGEQCGGNGAATFADFRACGFRDLYVVATNLETHREQIFSARHTPEVAVVDALVLSQSIPLFFEAPRFDGKQLGKGALYADGGLVNDYPLQIFDNADHYREDNSWFIHGINWQTLGCRLYTPDDCDPPNERTPIKSLIGYLSNLIATMMAAQDSAYGQIQVDRRRTIDISDCCVNATDFDIQLEPPDKKYTELCEAGYQATKSYLAHYQAPKPIDRE